MPTDTVSAATGDAATQNAVGKDTVYDANAAIEAILFPPTSEANGEAAVPETEAEDAGQAPDADVTEDSGDAGAADADATEASESEVLSQEAEETTASSDSETTEQEHDVADNEPNGVQKRINKLVKQRHELEAKLKEQEAKIAELAAKAEQAAKVDEVAAPVAAPTADNPYANLTSEAEIEKAIDVAYQTIEVLEANPDGYSYTDANGKEVSLDRAGVARAKVAAQKAVNRYLPAQKQFLQQRAAVLPEVKRLYPQIFDRTNPAYAAAQAMLKQMPALRALPNYEQIVARYLVGEAYEAKVLAEKAKPTKAAAAPVKKAPVQPAKPAVAPKPQPRKGEQEAVAFRDRWKKSGDQRDLAEYLGRIL